MNVGPSNKAFQPPAGGPSRGVTRYRCLGRPPRLNASVGRAKASVRQVH